VTRECLAAIPDTSISGRRVARELTALIKRRGKPRMMVSDNGTEFTSNVPFHPILFAPAQDCALHDGSARCPVAHTAPKGASTAEALIAAG
jgi:hypothetical protein